MQQLGLEERMVKIIMSCIQFVSYSVLLNGQLVGNIKPSRGLCNRDKTNIFFSSNTSPQVQTSIQQLLGVSTIYQYEKYLGLPALVGRAKKQSFIYLKERVWRKLQGWKEKLLS